ncbi:MAG: TRAP transporter small permease [Spirochaetes bacterium]|nr:TRAP transporter small permease [Spirochaetota bacterium]
MVNLLKKVFNAILIFSVAISDLMLLGIVGIVTYNVFLRYFFGGGLPWGEEMPSFVLLPGYVAIAIVIGVKEDLHINLNILPRKLPKMFELFLHILKYVCIIFVGCILFYYGIYLSVFFRGSILPSLNMPNSIQFIFFPVGGVLMVLSGIIKLFNLEKEEEHLKSIWTGYNPDDEKKGEI